MDPLFNLSKCKTLARTLVPAALVATSLVCIPVRAHEAGHENMPEHMHEHAQEPGMATELKRSVVDLDVTSGTLVRQDGSTVNLKKLLDNGKPVVLAFIYTSCTAVCPLTSHILSEAQDLLGDDLDKVQMLSITIDPEYDTPARLKAYARTLGAKPQWQHYTGSPRNIVTVQKEFGAYRGDKMNHDSLIFVNGGGKKQWVRFEGFPSPQEVVKELREQGKR